MSEQDAFLAEVERFLARSKMLPTLFGKAAVNDPKFVFDLRRGRECRRATREKVRGWIKENRPARARAREQAEARP